MPETKLVEDLRQIPNIIGSLGLAIAESQKLFDVEYLRGLERFVYLASQVDITNPTNRFVLQEVWPSRFHCTETTLIVKLDLAESRQGASQAGLGFGFAGIVLNGARTASYGSDYRAGAEIRVALRTDRAADQSALLAAIGDKLRTTPSGSEASPALRPTEERSHKALKDLMNVVG